MNRKILLIDDDESISEVIQIFLEEQGYKVKSYVDGLDIVGKINKAKPGIILLDYLLPGKNGVEIAREIRKKLSARKLPLIMIAANTIYKEESQTVGIDAFLEKPFDLYELLKIVKHYLKSTN